MSFVLQRYFSNLIVCVILEAKECRLIAQEVKKGRVLKTYKTVFENKNQEKLDKKIIEYLERKKKEYCDVYLCVLSNSLGQGAIEGTSAKEFSSHTVDIKNVKKTSIENSWSAYISYIDFKWLKGLFEPFSPDLMYSPFVMLHRCIKKHKIPQEPILYLYIHEDNFAVGVFRQTHLLFGAFYKTEFSQDDDAIKFSNDWSLAKEESGLETVLQNDDLEELDELNDLDDSLDDELDFDLEDDNILDKKLKEELGDEEDIDPEASISLLSRDMLMYKHLKSAIDEFYQNPIYKHNFLSRVVIFNNHELSDTFVKTVQNELFMSVDVHQVNSLEIMAKMAKEDLRL